jgi:hypothetical protein
MMTGDQEFQMRMAGIQTLIRQLDRSADPAVRTSVKELLESVMELHGTALNRVLEIALERDASGTDFIEAVGEDSLTGSLLILHGLHPKSAAARVAKAIEGLAPLFRKFGAEVQLEGVEGSVARLQIRGDISAAAGRTLKSAIEEQIYSLAPDITMVEGLRALGASDLVEIETSQRANGLVVAAKGSD